MATSTSTSRPRTLLATLRRGSDREAGDVVVDCMDLTFIDAAGIRAFVVVHAELDQQGRCLCLVHPSPFLTRMLEILDLTHLIASEPVGADST